MQLRMNVYICMNLMFNTIARSIERKSFIELKALNFSIGHLLIPKHIAH